MPCTKPASRKFAVSSGGASRTRSITRRRGEPHPVYYSPEMAVRAHDHNYILRLISDRIALLAPARFCLLPQYRSLDPQFT